MLLFNFHFLLANEQKVTNLKTWSMFLFIVSALSFEAQIILASSRLGVAYLYV